MELSLEEGDHLSKLELYVHLLGRLRYRAVGRRTARCEQVAHDRVHSGAACTTDVPSTA